MNEVSLNIKKFIAETMPECITAALNDACQAVENKAVDKCPVDDGTLRASITHSVEQDENVFTGTVGSNVEYAPYVHEGTGIYAREGKGRQKQPQQPISRNEKAGFQAGFRFTHGISPSG